MLKKYELACLYISHRLALIDSQDLRIKSDNENIVKRVNRIKRDLKYFSLDPENRFAKYYFDKYAKLDLNWIDKLFKKHYQDIKSLINYKNYFYPVNVTCCDSCHWGSSSTSKNEIEVQRTKFNGNFICKSCESKANNIDDTDIDTYYFTGTAAYRDDGIENPRNSLLGFGGARYIIKSNNGKIRLTNNLINIMSLHKCFYNIVKHKVNCEIFGVKSFENENLIKYLTKEEIYNIQDQLNKAKRLGHKI